MKPIYIDKLRGLLNVVAEDKLPLGALAQADNVVIINKGKALRREGSVLARAGTAITGSYATTDSVRMFFIDNGTLSTLYAGQYTTITTGFPVEASFWCEEAPSRVFVMSGERYGMIDNGVTYTELTYSPVAGYLSDLAVDTEGFPTNNVSAITYHNGSVVVAVKVDDGVSRVQFSIPGEYSIFHKVKGRFEIPDEVTWLESVNGRLLITCDHGIYSYDSENRLTKLAEYGTPKGKPVMRMPDNGCYIWTTRGVAKYPEFENLTQKDFTVKPGTGCAANLYRFRGDFFMLVGSDGLGIAY